MKKKAAETRRGDWERRLFDAEDSGTRRKVSGGISL